MRFLRPRVVVSECLGFRPVRYDGNMNYDATVETLKKFAELIPVCPEVGAGLGVPRNPVILMRDGDRILLIDTGTGENFADRVNEFAKSFLGGLIGVDGFLLKSKSPSCGVGDAKLYGRGRAVIARSDGLFASIVRAVFPLLPIEGEKRLLKYEIRRNFFTRLFAIAELRETLSNADAEELVKLHRRNKYLLMLYSPLALKTLGRLLAERKKRDPRELGEAYRDLFLRALTRRPPRGAYANVFTHIYGHIKEKLEHRERRYILTLIERYRRGIESLKTIMTYFRGFVHRFDEEYLAEQRFIEPYPEELEPFDEESAEKERI